MRLYLLSHHAKIASRIEIFTSSYAYRRLEWETHARFQRLGFVSFQSNEQSNFTARELKIIAFPTQEKVTMIRLVLHSCHANPQNMFEQVGLLSVVAAQAICRGMERKGSPV
uniref:Centrosomal protein CEP104 N-terminal domain-containing protein n=1 Tax=Globisporangium ultimum (strain ATCC 200006 / CBS 805.95 / DAOM BR144) TaxID=431595 RepID=K3WU05_GLOUD